MKKKEYLSLDLQIIDFANDIVTESGQDNRPFTEGEFGLSDIY